MAFYFQHRTSIEVYLDEEGFKKEYVQFPEMKIKMKAAERNLPLCEFCVRERRFEKCVAVFLCFGCERYVCRNCLHGHKWHVGMKKWRKESERDMKKWASASGKIEEQSLRKNVKTGNGFGTKTKRMRLEDNDERMEMDSERNLSLFLDDLINESKTERIEKLKNSHARIYDRVYVKHELDKRDCRISGICGLGKKRWVACDIANNCIKIFELGSNVLQRYIRFPMPCDVTELLIGRNSTESNLECGSSSGVSSPDQAKEDTDCLIAILLPANHQILFVDLSKIPALLLRVIHTQDLLCSIQFYDNKIFTTCTVSSKCNRSSAYIHVYSTDGHTLKQFDIDRDQVRYLAVVSGRVYLTDQENNKVQCRNVEGKVIKEIVIEGSGPTGITVDPDNNLYVCAMNDHKVYKLDADLNQRTSVLDQTSDYIEYPLALCYYRDKLFMSYGHIYPTPLKNYVNVVRLL